MKAIKQQQKMPCVSSITATLLAELEEECQHILKFLAQLEIAELTEAQRETILGELSTTVMHLHEHTRGLDAILDEDCGA